MRSPLIARELPDACVGAGTVLNAARSRCSVERAGARFAISPGATDERCTGCARKRSERSR
jgi:2-keto-3-deoxy-6-phosphogluconate aldolase